jgi:hypothetical protein
MYNFPRRINLCNSPPDSEDREVHLKDGCAPTSLDFTTVDVATVVPPPISSRYVFTVGRATAIRWFGPRQKNNVGKCECRKLSRFDTRIDPIEPIIF